MKIGAWSSFSPPIREYGDLSPLSEPCGDESQHSTNSPIGLNNDQGPQGANAADTTIVRLVVLINGVNINISYTGNTTTRKEFAIP